MTPVEPANLDLEAKGLLFDVRRSIRYHDKRAAFFERTHRVTNATTILLASSVLFEIAYPDNKPNCWMQALALAGSFLAVLDLVVGLSVMGNKHRDLQRRFAMLEISLMADPKHVKLSKHQQERLLIEIDEPSPYVALDSICRNELLRAMGEKTGYVEVRWWHRLTCHLWTWTNEDLKLRSDPVDK